MIVYLQSNKHKKKQRIGVPAFIVGILFLLVTHPETHLQLWQQII